MPELSAQALLVNYFRAGENGAAHKFAHEPASYWSMGDIAYHPALALFQGSCQICQQIVHMLYADRKPDEARVDR